jgi:hypothetical protein
VDFVPGKLHAAHFGKNGPGNLAVFVVGKA